MDIINSRYLTVEVKGITCDLDFDDPEDGTWLSSSDTTGDYDTAYLDDTTPVSMFAFSSDGDDDEASLTVAEVSSSALAVNSSTALSLTSSSSSYILSL